jgi:hypothetical protein
MKRTPTKTPATTAGAPPKLLSGGNPQTAKGDGDSFVQEYLANMPEWKGQIGQQLDALIVQTIPNVCKAVRWNTPFYGIEGQGWFVAFHCNNRYVKVTFFRGTSLDPVPPVASKVEGVRYVHIHENDVMEEALFENWIKQAAALPGDRCF